MVIPKGQPPLIGVGMYSYQIGGAERIGSELALQYRSRGYRVLCFALYDTQGPIRVELEQRGVPCFDLDYTTRYRPTRRLLFQLEMWRFLRREGVSALHLHHATSLILAGIAARLAPVKRLVMTEHALHELREKPGYRLSAARYCRLAQAIAVVAPDQLDYLRDQMGVPPSKLHLIPNGVHIVPADAAVRGAVRAELGLEQQQFMFLFAGRLHETKDLPTLLRAVALWPEHLRHRACVVLAGGGPERAALEELCRSLGLQSTVRFLGARSDVRQLQMAADAFVMSSRTEGLPMALLEAMASNLPCIATAVGGIPELLRNGAGVLVPPAEPDALARAMDTLASSDETRNAIRVRAMARIHSDFQIDAVVTRYLALLGLPAQWAGDC